MLDLADEVWETFPACNTRQKSVSFVEISSKSGSQKAPELPNTVDEYIQLDPWIFCPLVNP